VPAASIARLSNSVVYGAFAKPGKAGELLRHSWSITSPAKHNLKHTKTKHYVKKKKNTIKKNILRQ